MSADGTAPDEHARATSGAPAPEGGDLPALADEIERWRRGATTNARTTPITLSRLDAWANTARRHRCASAPSVATPPQEGEGDRLGEGSAGHIAAPRRELSEIVDMLGPIIGELRNLHTIDNRVAILADHAHQLTAAWRVLRSLAAQAPDLAEDGPALRDATPAPEVPALNREALLDGLHAALFGTEDGAALDDEDTTVPVGEYRRLLREWADAPPTGNVVQVTVAPSVILRHAVELTDDARPGEDMWDRQARGLAELGYRITGRETR